METVEFTWGKALQVWWAITWRAVLAALLLGAIAGFLIGLIFGVLRFPTETISSIGTLSGSLLGVICSVYFTQYALTKKRFKSFKILIVANDQ